MMLVLIIERVQVACRGERKEGMSTKMMSTTEFDCYIMS
jgi:hypothetical protein